MKLKITLITLLSTTAIFYASEMPVVTESIPDWTILGINDLSSKIDILAEQMNMTPLSGFIGNQDNLEEKLLKKNQTDLLREIASFLLEANNKVDELLLKTSKHKAALQRHHQSHP